jgi:hydrophobic/amphiphilic exporter-1 (mainly G- bacteria), HAE1 family
VGVDDMLYMKSTSGNDGSYTLTVSFAVGTDADINTVNVQNRVAQALPKLPEEVQRQGVTCEEIGRLPADGQPLFARSEPRRALSLELRHHQRHRPDQARCPASATPTSVRQPRLRHAGLARQRPADRPRPVAQRPRRRHPRRRTSRPRPAGSAPSRWPMPSFQLNIQTQGRLTDVAEFERIVVRANPDGSFVRVGDVGRVELGARTADVRSRFNGSDGAVIAIQQLPGSTPSPRPRACAALLEEAERALSRPASPTRSPTTPRASSRRASRRWSHADRGLRPRHHRGLPLPRQRAGDADPADRRAGGLIGTFAVMLALGFSANTVSLLALVLAIGIVVDDAIVVVENVERQVMAKPDLSGRRGHQARRWARSPAPIIAITLVLLSVFVPVAFIPGISGQLFQQFAVAVSVAMVISAINALTLSPALCAPHRPGARRLCPHRRRHRAPRGPRPRAARRRLRSHRLVREPPALGFLPSEDQGAFFAEIRLPDGASANRTEVVVARGRGASSPPCPASRAWSRSPATASSTAWPSPPPERPSCAWHPSPTAPRRATRRRPAIALANIRGAAVREARSSPTTCRPSSASAPARASSTSSSTARAARRANSPPPPAG